MESLLNSEVKFLEEKLSHEYARKQELKILENDYKPVVFTVEDLSFEQILLLGDNLSSHIKQNKEDKFTKTNNLINSLRAWCRFETECSIRTVNIEQTDDNIENTENEVYPTRNSTYFRNCYRESLIRLNELGVEILTLKIFPHRFSDEYIDVYNYCMKFKCSKNGYFFDTLFIDTCTGGALVVNSCKYQEQKMWCYCNLKVEDCDTNAFIECLNDHPDVFKQKYFEPFSKLNDALGYELVVDTSPPFSQLVLNSTRLNYYIKDTNRDILLIPHIKDDKFSLMITFGHCTNLNGPNQPITSIQQARLYEYVDIEYDDAHSVEQILEFTNKFAKYRTGNFGFPTGNSYFNKFTIQQELGSKLGMKIKNEEDLLTGKSIDTTIFYSHGHNIYEYLADKPYVVTRYKFHFTYQHGDEVILNVRVDSFDANEALRFLLESKDCDKNMFEIINSSDYCSKGFRALGTPQNLLKQVKSIIYASPEDK